MTRKRTIDLVLGGLVIFDLLLVVWAFGFPELWFEAFHGTSEVTDQGRLLLLRTGGAWAAFALCQAIAWRVWRSSPVWLAVVAGIRLGDMLTDPIYVLLADDPTWFAWAVLPAAGVANLALGVFLLSAYRRVRRRR